MAGRSTWIPLDFVEISEKSTNERKVVGIEGKRIQHHLIFFNSGT